MSEQQQGDLTAVQNHKEVNEHPLSIWTRLVPGDVVAFLAPEGTQFAGTIESKTRDGLIIWIRDDLNERRVFHFRECNAMQVLEAAQSTTT